MNTDAASIVKLVNGAHAPKVFRQVNGAAETGANSSFSRTIMANGAIALGADSTLMARVLCNGTARRAGPPCKRR